MVDNAFDHSQCVSLKSLSNECFSIHRFSPQVKSLSSSSASSSTTSLFQFHRSDGVVHVHVWLCQTVQPSPVLKSANAFLNIRDYPRLHTQVSIKNITMMMMVMKAILVKIFNIAIVTMVTIMMIMLSISCILYIIAYIIFCSIIVENCAVICMWGGDW